MNVEASKGTERELQKEFMSVWMENKPVRRNLRKRMVQGVGWGGCWIGLEISGRKMSGLIPHWKVILATIC